MKKVKVTSIPSKEAEQKLTLAYTVINKSPVVLSTKTPTSILRVKRTSFEESNQFRLACDLEFIYKSIYYLAKGDKLFKYSDSCKPQLRYFCTDSVDAEELMWGKTAVEVSRSGFLFCFYFFYFRNFG